MLLVTFKNAIQHVLLVLGQIIQQEYAQTAKVIAKPARIIRIVMNVRMNIICSIMSAIKIAQVDIIIMWT